jgi:hypothetical protein
MGKILELRGVIIRNLTPSLGESGDAVEAAHKHDSPDEVKWETHPLEQRNGTSCFFSLHTIDQSTGVAESVPFYTSTLCPHLCNPSWTDVDFNDFDLRGDGPCLRRSDSPDTRHFGSCAADAYCMRVWVHRPLPSARRRATQAAADDDAPQHPPICPRYAPWRMPPTPGAAGTIGAAGPPPRIAWPLFGEDSGPAEGAARRAAAAAAAAAAAFENTLVLDVRIALREWARLGPSLAELRVAPLVPPTARRAARAAPPELPG